MSNLAPAKRTGDARQSCRRKGAANATDSTRFDNRPLSLFCRSSVCFFSVLFFSSLRSLARTAARSLLPQARRGGIVPRAAGSGREASLSECEAERKKKEKSYEPSMRDLLFLSSTSCLPRPLVSLDLFSLYKKKKRHSATTSTTSALWSLAEKSSLAVVAERALRPP